MGILCKMFGHLVPRHGYYLNQPYFRRGGNTRITDGIGRIHQSLVANCSRCETEFTIGRIHDYRLSAKVPHRFCWFNDPQTCECGEGKEHEIHVSNRLDQ